MLQSLYRPSFLGLYAYVAVAEFLVYNFKFKSFCEDPYKSLIIYLIGPPTPMYVHIFCKARI